MDVTLVLTHRCNLDCHYCYAGRHLAKDMDDDTIERALDLLYVDGANTAQLGFFGGEPFLARDKLVRAVHGARHRAEAAGAELLIQCTTNGTLLDRDDIDFIVSNGIRVTVSIDGIREAHEMNRPRAGGRSSFDTVVANLRSLIAHGANPEVCMVVTPDTVPFVYRSVSWFWDEGVGTVRMNLELGAHWDALDRHELEQELTVVGWDMLARRVRGEQVVFAPFMSGIRSAARVLEMTTKSVLGYAMEFGATSGSSCSHGSRAAKRLQVVVATTGNLYPCAPMVGEDDDDGPEAALRIGHIEDGLEALAQGLVAQGANCSDGKECACAAYLETGDRTHGGPMGLWFGRVGEKLGRAVGAGFFADRHRVASGSMDNTLRPRWHWRAVIAGLAAATSGVALLASTMMRGGITGGERLEPGVRYIPVSVPFNSSELERDTRKPMPAPIDSLPLGSVTMGVFAEPFPAENDHFAGSRDDDWLLGSIALDMDEPSLVPHANRPRPESDTNTCVVPMALGAEPECHNALNTTRDDPE